VIAIDELELINTAKKGNKSSLNTLLTENLNILKGYVIKMTGDPHLSQDIIQDTMLKAVLNIKKFEPKAKFSTWLIKISINVYRDYLRKSKTLVINEETLEENIHRFEDVTISRLEYEEILKIVQKLSHEKRSAFILKHYYGYKYEEIAEILGCPVGTVRSRIHNAVKQIITEMEIREMT
jgi:RNA polymerase sigma-70 factor, ECF subfamily